ncbi:MAG: YdcF family protein, partial [Planctomycetaceae bacterium]
ADVVDGLHPPAAEVLSGVLRHRGILGKQIVCLEAASRTTFDDAHALSAFLERRPQDRVIVVTNAFHTRRARFVFQRVLGDNADRLQFVAAPNPGFADETWWQNRSSAHMVLAENLKLVFYVFRYSGPSGWVVSLLFIAIVWRWQTLRVAGRTAPRARSNPAGGPSQGEPAR